MTEFDGMGWGDDDLPHEQEDLGFEAADIQDLERNPAFQYLMAEVERHKAAAQAVVLNYQAPVDLMRAAQGILSLANELMLSRLWALIEANNKLKPPPENRVDGEERRRRRLHTV